MTTLYTILLAAYALGAVLFLVLFDMTECGWFQKLVTALMWPMTAVYIAWDWKWGPR